MPDNRMIIVVGQEGVGKSTTIRSLAPEVPWSAQIDGADLARVNPWSLDELRLKLLWKNVASLALNYWEAGFRSFVSGSFLSNLEQYSAFRMHLDSEVDTYIIQLCAEKQIRDRRRIERLKPSTKEWRDHVDLVDPEDFTLAEGAESYRFLRIDNDDFSVEESIQLIRVWAPELFED